MTLVGGEVNVGNEEDGLGLKVRHHLEDGHVVALLEDGHLDVDDWRGRGRGGAERQSEGAVRQEISCQSDGALPTAGGRKGPL